MQERAGLHRHRRRRQGERELRRLRAGRLRPWRDRDGLRLRLLRARLLLVRRDLHAAQLLFSVGLRARLRSPGALRRRPLRASRRRLRFELRLERGLWVVPGVWLGARLRFLPLVRLDAAPGVQRLIDSLVRQHVVVPLVRIELVLPAGLWIELIFPACMFELVVPARLWVELIVPARLRLQLVVSLLRVEQPLLRVVLQRALVRIQLAVVRIELTVLRLQLAVLRLEQRPLVRLQLAVLWVEPILLHHRLIVRATRGPQE